MSRAQYQLAYNGPALRSGAMDVNELASSLLAVGDLLQEANRQLNGDRAKVSVRVKSDFQRGSFDVSLLLDQSLIEHAKNLLFPTTGVAALLVLVFGTEIRKKGLIGAADSVLDLWKKLKGEKPKTVIEDPERRVTIVVTGDGNQINVSPKAALLYQSDKVRSSLAKTIQPVAEPGISSLSILKGDKVVGQVNKADMPVLTGDSIEPGMTQTGKVFENTREVVLRVTRANFDEGKWGFSDGNANFSAEIEDEAFLKELDARERGFYKGDVMVVQLTTTQIVKSDTSIQTSYTITKVLQHIHSPKQESFPERFR
jgi:hypothetical protein